MNTNGILRATLLPLFAVGLLSVGCAKRSPRPLIPEGTVLAGMSQDAKFRGNQVLREMEAISAEVQEKNLAMLRESLDSEEVAPKIRELLGMGESDVLCYFFGDDVKREWGLTTLGASEILPDDFDESAISFPPLAIVNCFDRPVDMSRFGERLLGIVMEQITLMAESHDEDGEENPSPDEILAMIKESLAEEGIAIEAFQYRDRPAWRLTICNDEITGLVTGLQPVMAAIGDGRLVVIASSMAHLDEIARLYDGTAKPMREDAPLAREMVLPENVFSRVAIAEIDSVLRRFMTESAYADFRQEMAEDETVGPYLLAARNLRIDCVIDTPAREMELRVDLDLDSAEKAATLGNLVNAGKGFLVMGLSLFIAENPAAAPLSDLPSRISSKTEGSRTSAAVRISPDDIRALWMLQEVFEDLSESDSSESE